MENQKYLWLDLETYSPLELKKVGAYAYSEHPEFQIRLAGWDPGDGRVRVATGTEQTVRELAALVLDPRVIKVAHNANFDRVCLSRALGMPTGEYLDPSQWEDTMALASRAGLPASLDKLAKHLKVAEKDTAGTYLINLFSKPREGRMVTPQEEPEKWDRFVAYMRQDVITLREVHEAIPRVDGPIEREAWIADQRINDRGMKVDLELARLALAADEDNREQTMSAMSSLLGISNPNSTTQLMTALTEGLGLEIPNLRAETVSETLQRTDIGPDARRALEMRQEIALSASRKFDSILRYASDDGRLRGQFRYFGAHTGRWSSRGAQIQNLPRHQLDWPQAAITDLKLGLGADPSDLKALVRPTFVGPFGVADYASIEARVLAWVAGEKWAIEAFRQGRDIYVETAKRMGGLTRQQGKVAVLALGYQGGWSSLFHMGAEGTQDELEWLKVQWRRANRKIVKLWALLQEAFADGGRAGLLEVRVVGNDRHILLPSGRPIVYRNVRWERWVVELPNGKKARREGWRFDGSLGNRADTYGGRLTENAVQAISRELLAEAIVELLAAGFDVVGHVHDEVLIETSEESVLAQAIEVMTRNPEWAIGLPLDAEGFLTDRYRKG